MIHTLYHVIHALYHVIHALYHVTCMQGVIEFSLALFFNKLVSYTFLFWLPLYVKLTRKPVMEGEGDTGEGEYITLHAIVSFSDSNLSGPESDWLSTFFDVGGIIGTYNN